MKSSRTPEANSVLVLLRLAKDFFQSAVSAVGALFATFRGKNPDVPKNGLFEILDFLLRTGPKAYWRFPTAIAAGRSIGTFLKFVFSRSAFHQKK